MSSAMARTPRMTRDRFFGWAEVQDLRYEFDGFEPVAMVGGTNDHSLICRNTYAALRAGLPRRAEVGGAPAHEGTKAGQASHVPMGSAPPGTWRLLR